VLTRAVCDLAVADAADLTRVRAATGQRWRSPTATEDALVRAFRRLREAGERWAQLRSAEALRGTWTQ
jgi:hypothetical protein